MVVVVHQADLDKDVLVEGHKEAAMPLVDPASRNELRVR
jgi:hypothetical protein